MSGYLPADGGERVRGEAALCTGMLGTCRGQWGPVSWLLLLLPEA